MPLIEIRVQRGISQAFLLSLPLKKPACICSIYNDLVPAPSRRTSRTRGCSLCDCPLCFHAFWTSHGHTVGFLENPYFALPIPLANSWLQRASWKCCPPVCFPHFSTASTLLRSGRFHSAVRRGSAKHRESSTGEF